jgi:hypothetical protein
MFSSKYRSKSIIGTLLFIFGIFAIGLAIVITPTFATNYLSPDHNITVGGLNQLDRLRLISSLGGLLLFISGLILLMVKNLEARLQRILILYHIKILYGFGICALCVIVGLVYARQILPVLIAHPFRQDFGQDYIGAQALLHRSNELYPVLAPAFEKIGIPWNVYHRSTHPPTAFLLVVPFAMIAYRASAILWMTTMFACIVVAAHALGLTWRFCILVGLLSLAWPPTVWSLYQFTPIWLLGLVLAYRYRHKPIWSGVLIAFASLPKYLAAPALLYHLWRRKWSALIGFVAIWLIALVLLVLLRNDVFTSYISSNIGNSLMEIKRPDNGALLVVAWRVGGWIGLVSAAVLILCILWFAIRNENPAGWGCIVWLGIALLPIAWDYSLLPLLPWLLLALRTPRIIPRTLVGLTLLVPFASPTPGSRPDIVALSIVLSGITLALVSEMEIRETAMSDYQRTQSTDAS